MFLLDSLLLAPGKAVLFMFEELAKKAQEEFLDDDSVKQELQEIYMSLESGTISEKEFEAREFRLLQRLEQIARAKFEGGWGTPGLGLQRAFLDSVQDEALDMVAIEAAPVDVEADLQVGLGEPVHAPTDLGRPPRIPDVSPQVGEPPIPPPAQPAALPAAQPALPPALPPAVADAPPAPPPAVVMATPTPAPPPTLTMSQVIESTLRHLAMLKLKVSAVTAVARTDNGWRVTAELLERRAVPDTSDLLGVYDLQLDAAGDVLCYERTHMRRRCDLGR
jgi:hypothetical protein